MRYSDGFGFQLEYTTKVSDETGFVWTEDTALYGADNVTDTELGNSELRKHFKLWGNDRLGEYDNGSVISLERIS